MNSLILPAFVAVTAAFHLALRTHIRRGNVKTGFCAVWCMDAVFAVCGTIISFILYRYLFSPYLTMRNILLGVMYLILTILFLLLAPSGISLLAKRKRLSEDEVLCAEYRFNDTLGFVRNGFLILLFALPVLFALAQEQWIPLLAEWQEAEICGGFCFAAFLVLVPVSLRQALFWMKNLTDPPTETEEELIRRYRAQYRFRHRNWIL